MWGEVTSKPLQSWMCCVTVSAAIALSGLCRMPPQAQQLHALSPLTSGSAGQPGPFHSRSGLDGLILCAAQTPSDVFFQVELVQALRASHAQVLPPEGVGQNGHGFVYTHGLLSCRHQPAKLFMGGWRKQKQKQK